MHLLGKLQEKGSAQNGELPFPSFDLQIVCFGVCFTFTQPNQLNQLWGNPGKTAKKSIMLKVLVANLVSESVRVPPTKTAPQMGPMKLPVQLMLSENHRNIYVYT